MAASDARGPPPTAAGLPRAARRRRAGCTGRRAVAYPARRSTVSRKLPTMMPTLAIIAIAVASAPTTTTCATAKRPGCVRPAVLPRRQARRERPRKHRYDPQNHSARSAQSGSTDRSRAARIAPDRFAVDRLEPRRANRRQRGQDAADDSVRATCRPAPDARARPGSWPPWASHPIASRAGANARSKHGQTQQYPRRMA